MLDHRSARWLLVVALLGGAPALAQEDSDADGVPDGADAFPCEPAFASVVQSSSMLVFEDQWPDLTDLDFNDVVIRAHYRILRDAAQATRRVVLTIDPLALGGEYSNGLALQLPVPGRGATIHRRLGGGPWSPLAPELDSELTVVLSPALRELFDGRRGRINAVPSELRVPGTRLEVQIDLVDGVPLDASLAPFDLFTFRVGDLGHQIHFPEFRGTAVMNTTLFGRGVDGSRIGRSFVHENGIPFALNLQDATRYPHEAIAIDALFPDIAAFAASGGTLNRDFYRSRVRPEHGFDVGPGGAPPEEPVEVRCTHRFAWQTGPHGACEGGVGAWLPGAWSACDGGPGDCGTGVRRRGHACSPVAGSGVRERAVWCLRSDGVSVDDAFCAGPRPEAAEGCTPVTATCGAQPPVESEVCSETSGCVPTWGCGPWSACSNVCGGTETCAPVCQRLYDGEWSVTVGCGGTPVTSRTCGSSAALGHTWQAATWGACSDVCGGTQTRDVWCRRECDGARVDGGHCGGVQPGSSASCGSPGALGYNWQAGDWSGCSNACGGTQTRDVWCRRACDGARVDDALCGAGRPASSNTCGSPGALGYTWQAGDWSGCSSACGGTQTRDVWCRRSCDGARVDGALCGGGQPASTTACGSVDALGGTWQGSYAQCSGCSAAYSDPIQGLWCRRSCDGANVGSASCYGQEAPAPQSCPHTVASCRRVQTSFWSRSQASTSASLPARGPLESGRTGTRDSNDRFSDRCQVVGGHGYWDTSQYDTLAAGECWVSGRRESGGSLGFFEDDPSGSPEGGSWTGLGNGTNPTYTCADAGYGGEVSWGGDAARVRSGVFHCDGTAPNRNCYFVRYCQ
jgi:LruC domain-containing protein